MTLNTERVYQANSNLQHAKSRLGDRRNQGVVEMLENGGERIKEAKKGFRDLARQLPRSSEEEIEAVEKLLDEAKLDVSVGRTVIEEAVPVLLQRKPTR